MKRYGRFSQVLLAASAALAAAPSFAQSSGVTLYGMVDDAVVYANNQLGHSNWYLRQGNLYASKFGLKGVENLGGGLNAIFDLQEGFDLNTGAQQTSGLAFNRYAYVGLQDKVAGTLTMGRQYTPYYLLVGPLSSSTWLTGATGAHPGDIDGLDTTIRINNAVTYTSANMYGFTASGMYAFGGIAGSLASGRTLSGALSYANGPVALAAGYLRLNNTQRTAGFDPASTGSFGTSAVNAGFVSAKTVQHVAVSGNYTIGNLLLGLTYSNVEYVPGARSVFTDTEVFNTYAALAVYRFTPTFDVGGGFAYTMASAANGVTSPARYQQYSLKEAYHLSKRTTLYALQGYTHSTGQTLAAAGIGNIVNANALVGDAENGTPSSNRKQFVGMVGMAVTF